MNFIIQVYLEAMKTSKVYARDVTTVSPLAIALFGGRLKLFERQSALTVDSWLAFKASPPLMRLLSTIRDQMESAFSEKVLDPLAEISPQWMKVLSAVERLVGGGCSKLDFIAKQQSQSQVQQSKEPIRSHVGKSTSDAKMANDLSRMEITSSAPDAARMIMTRPNTSPDINNAKGAVVDLQQSLTSTTGRQGYKQQQTTIQHQRLATLPNRQVPEYQEMQQSPAQLLQQPRKQANQRFNQQAIDESGVIKGHKESSRKQPSTRPVIPPPPQSLELNSISKSEPHKGQRSQGGRGGKSIPPSGSR